MRKLYEKPEMIFEQFRPEEIMEGEEASMIEVLDTLTGITIDYTTGNKLNSINYQDFVQ